MEPPDRGPRLNRSLERLPTSQALPPQLPPVMATGDEGIPARWYRREWRHWPVGWQIASLGACIGVVALLFGRGPSEVLATWTGAGMPAEAVANRVEPSVAALQVLWRVVFEPLLPAAVAVVVAMVVACVAIGLTLHYVVSGRTWHR